MKEGKTGSTAWIKGVLLVFIALTLSVGLSSCGDDGDSVDYKGMLKKTSQYITDLEEENQAITTELKEVTEKLNGKEYLKKEKKAAAEITKLKAENQALAKLRKQLASEIDVLKGKVAKCQQINSEKDEQLKAQGRTLSEQKAAYEAEISLLKQEIQKNDGVPSS